MASRVHPLRLALAAGAALILQSSLMPYVRVFGAGPDLPLLLVVYVGLFHGDKGIELAALAGLAIGLLMDTLSLAPLGLNGAAKALEGLLVSLLSLHIFPENRLVQAAVAAGAAVTQELVFHFSAKVLLDIVPPETGSLSKLGALAAWNGLAALILFPFLHATTSRSRGPEPYRASESLEI